MWNRWEGIFQTVWDRTKEIGNVKVSVTPNTARWGDLMSCDQCCRRREVAEAIFEGTMAEQLPHGIKATNTEIQKYQWIPKGINRKLSSPGQIQTVKWRNTVVKFWREKKGMIAICVRTVVMDRPLGKVPWGFLKLYALYPNFGNWSMSIFIIIIVYHVNLCVF